MRLVLFLPILALLLLPSCASKLSEIRDDIGVIAKNGVAITKAVKELPAQMDAKLDAAAAKYRALGAPVDGTPSEVVAWGTQNIGKILSGGGLLSFLAVLYRAYRRAKKGLTAAVDAAETLPPKAAQLFKKAAQASPHMTADVAGLIAALKAR